MTNYLKLTVSEIHKLLKDKKIKPIDLVMESLDKINKYKWLNAIITVDKEGAIKKALELENSEIDNIYFGIPIVVKDNIVTKNLKTTCGSKMLENFIPIYDASIIEFIKRNNMIIIGKSNMDEFAMGSTGETSYFGPTLNPWNKEYVSGGSSSGSASVVSSGIVPFALGSDTGGSIRQPASHCGVVGLKPTYGLVSRYGLVSFGSSIDQIGPMTRNVYENALLLNLISKHDERDLNKISPNIDYTSLIGENIKGMKIAIPNFYMSEIVDIAIRKKILDIISILEGNGVIVDYIDIDYLEYSVPLYQIIAMSEASSNLACFDGVKYGFSIKEYKDADDLYIRSRSIGFGEEIKRRIMIGSFVLSGENAHIYYEKALKVRNKMRKSFKEAFKKYDLIIGPVSTTTAHKLNDRKNDQLKSFYDDLLTIPSNMAGIPSLSLPIGFINELPIGMQIIGNSFDEINIYKLAYFIERKLNLNLIPEMEVEYE